MGKLDQHSQHPPRHDLLQDRECTVGYVLYHKKICYWNQSILDICIFFIKHYFNFLEHINSFLLRFIKGKFIWNMYISCCGKIVSYKYIMLFWNFYQKTIGVLQLMIRLYHSLGLMPRVIHLTSHWLLSPCIIDFFVSLFALALWSRSREIFSLLWRRRHYRWRIAIFF